VIKSKKKMMKNDEKKEML